MNIDSLRYFAAVAKYRNITKAAEKLYITQSALSKNLQRLEKELNVELFERTKTSIHLTEIGEYCLKEVQQLLCHADNVLAAVKGYSNGEYGTLVIGHTGGENIGLYSLIDKISKAYPQIEINLHKASPPELLRCVLNFK